MSMTTIQTFASVYEYDIFVDYHLQYRIESLWCNCGIFIDLYWIYALFGKEKNRDEE